LNKKCKISSKKGELFLSFFFSVPKKPVISAFFEKTFSESILKMVGFSNFIFQAACPGVMARAIGCSDSFPAADRAASGKAPPG
jgi:hypothetical protein